MLEQLIEFDQELFLLINREWTSWILDVILPALRHKYFWAPVYMFFLAFLVYNFRMQGVAVGLFVILTIVFSDQISSTFIKHIVERIRPCNDPDFMEQVRLLVGCGSGFSFTSSHAANHFALAAVLSALLHKAIAWIWPVTLIWAGAVCYAQVYVGVHYPLDVIAGGILGLLIGLVVAFFAKRFTKFDP